MAEIGGGTVENEQIKLQLKLILWDDAVHPCI